MVTAQLSAASDAVDRGAWLEEPVDRTDRNQRPRAIHAVTAVVLASGVMVTVALVAATRSAYDGNEDRLLQERTRQAAAVLDVALPGIQTPLASAVEVAEQSDGDPASFRRLMSTQVERGRPYVSASLWRVGADTRPVLAVGAEPKLVSEPPHVIREFLDRSVATKELAVLGLLDGDNPRLGYSYTSSTGPIRYVAYAEAALPADRTSVVQPDSAFAGLDHAVYLGSSEQPDSLLTASTAELPLTGRRASETVEFGDSTLLLVMTPTTELGGPLLAMLPWLVAVVGGLTTIGAALLVERLLRRQDQANLLADQNRELYANQLSVARQLQQSLLPQRMPEIAGLEVSARYVPGVAGLDIGGDWYDVIDIDHERVIIVVGDVSGRGLEAGTLMASLRYAIRAFASRGDDPAAILTGLTRLLDLDQDGHFATVLCASVHTTEHTITIANAGHPNPLLIDATGARFLTTALGPPIGVTRDATYDSITHRVAPGSTLIVFTDGAFERRGETVDAGMDRLRRSVPEPVDG